MKHALLLLLMLSGCDWNAAEQHARCIADGGCDAGSDATGGGTATGGSGPTGGGDGMGGGVATGGSGPTGGGEATGGGLATDGGPGVIREWVVPGTQPVRLFPVDGGLWVVGEGPGTAPVRKLVNGELVEAGYPGPSAAFYAANGAVTDQLLIIESPGNCRLWRLDGGTAQACPSYDSFATLYARQGQPMLSFWSTSAPPFSYEQDVYTFGGTAPAGGNDWTASDLSFTAAQVINAAPVVLALEGQLPGLTDAGTSELIIDAENVVGSRWLSGERFEVRVGQGPGNSFVDAWRASRDVLRMERVQLTGVTPGAVSQVDATCDAGFALGHIDHGALTMVPRGPMSFRGVQYELEGELLVLRPFDGAAVVGLGTPQLLSSAPTVDAYVAEVAEGTYVLWQRSGEDHLTLSLIAR